MHYISYIVAYIKNVCHGIEARKAARTTPGSPRDPAATAEKGVCGITIPNGLTSRWHSQQRKMPVMVFSIKSMKPLPGVAQRATPHIMAVIRKNVPITNHLTDI